MARAKETRFGERDLNKMEPDDIDYVKTLAFEKPEKKKRDGKHAKKDLM